MVKKLVKSIKVVTCYMYLKPLIYSSSLQKSNLTTKPSSTASTQKSTNATSTAQSEGRDIVILP